MPFAPLAGRRRRVRRRLRDDQQLLDVLLESVGVAIVAWGADGRLTHASRRACELLGADFPAGADPADWMSQLRPRTASGIPMVCEDLPPVRALHGEVVRGVDVLVRIRDADVLLGMLARPLVDGKGHPRGAVLLLEDVTERRRDEAQLRSAQLDARRPHR